MPVPGAVDDLSTIETSDVTYDVDGDTFEAFLARPTGTRRGAIIVIHEIFGPVPHIHDVARRFAAAGYDALAPNLYSRIGNPDPTDVQASMAKCVSITDDRIVADLEAAAAYLRALPDGAAKVACIGFCSGGRQTLVFGVRSDAPDAVIDCWGGSVHRATPTEEVTPERPIAPITQIDQLSCPAFIVSGANDQNPSPEIVAEIGSRGAAAGKDVTTKVYEGAGHAFFADYRPSYSEPQAFELWDDVLAFLGRTIG